MQLSASIIASSRFQRVCLPQKSPLRHGLIKTKNHKTPCTVLKLIVRTFTYKFYTAKLFNSHIKRNGAISVWKHLRHLYRLQFFCEHPTAAETNGSFSRDTPPLIKQRVAPHPHKSGKIAICWWTRKSLLTYASRRLEACSFSKQEIVNNRNGSRLTIEVTNCYIKLSIFILHINTDKSYSSLFVCANSNPFK